MTLDAAAAAVAPAVASPAASGPGAAFAPAVAPSFPPAIAPPVWTPTHQVPPAGMAFWAAPDGTVPPAGQLPGYLRLVVVRSAGAWAQVQAVNGWWGWVDGRLLIYRR